MNSIKGALCASLFFVGSVLADLPLVGVSWNSPTELTAIAALSEQVRYVARSVAFVEASESAVEEFTKQGICHPLPRQAASGRPLFCRRSPRPSPAPRR